MIAITGATGHLGRIVVEKLKERGVDATEIVAAVRSPEKAQDLGAEVREADYSRPETLEKAFAGIDRLLLISGSEVGQRTAQHRNVIDAAKKAGVSFIAYTSGPYADRSPMKLINEHRATEQMIRESGIPFALLRNGWYIENYTGQIDQALEHGVIMGSAGDGKISAATREDLAEAAAVVISGDGHEGNVYELGGDAAFTMNEFADALTKQSGKEVVYRNMPQNAYAEALTGFGLPEGYAASLADADAAAAEGWLHIESGDLRRLIGHPTKSLSDAIAETLSD